MLEILYRIYEVCEPPKEEVYCDRFSSYSSQANKELEMNVIICETRDEFKDIIRDRFGKDIRFAFSKKLEVGSIYCVIIGEHCYDTERWFNKVEYTCDYCGSKVIQYIDRPIKIENYVIKYDFFGIEEYSKKRFCCNSCLNKYIEQEKAKIRPNSEQEFFINRDMFTEKVSGYIYKITKKSSGEFYIGQTMYAPIFRWGQHLKTERFDIKDILDYQFETIEIVPKNENILEREKYWIQKYYKENPTKSLNIMQTSGLEQVNIDDLVNNT